MEHGLSFHSKDISNIDVLRQQEEKPNRDPIPAFYGLPVRVKVVDFVVAHSIISERNHRQQWAVEPVSSPSICSCHSLWLTAQRRALTGRWEQEAGLCLRGNSSSPVFSCPPPTTSSCSPACLPPPPVGPPLSSACSQSKVDIVSWRKFIVYWNHNDGSARLPGYCYNIKVRQESNMDKSLSLRGTAAF